MLTMYDNEYFDEKKCSMPIVRDVEEAFASIRLVDDETTRKLLKEIEQSEFYNESRVTDRFGAQIYTSELSTGCKAALCVHYLQDKVIDLKECGTNARDSIIANCKAGYVIFYDSCFGIASKGHEEVIDVILKGKRFRRLSELNDFMNSYEYVE